MPSRASIPRVLVLSILLAACSSSPVPEVKSPADTVIGADMLARHHWALDRAEDAKGARVERLFARADAPLQLDFSGDRIVVANDCNRISVAYA
jgi:hypothetical protein